MPLLWCLGRKENRRGVIYEIGVQKYLKKFCDGSMRSDSVDDVAGIDIMRIQEEGLCDGRRFR